MTKIFSLLFFCLFLNIHHINALECGIDYFEDWSEIRYDHHGRPIYTGNTGCFVKVSDHHNDCWKTHDCWQYVPWLDAMVFNPTAGGNAYRLVSSIPGIPINNGTYILIILLILYALYIYINRKKLIKTNNQAHHKDKKKF